MREQSLLGDTIEGTIGPSDLERADYGAGTPNVSFALHVAGRGGGLHAGEAGQRRVVLTTTAPATANEPRSKRGPRGLLVDRGFLVDRLAAPLC